MRPPLKTDRALAAGLLAALGLCGTARLVAAEPQDPRPDAPAPTAPASDAVPAPIAPPSPMPTPAVDPDAPFTILLLNNGRVLRGEIQKNAAGYVLKGKIGVSVYPRQQVERVFRTMAEAYAYKKAVSPENDPDERMKLALWCLEQTLKDEAKAELAGVLELSPDNRRAKAMLANLQPPPALAARPERDDAVALASGTLEIPPTDPPADANLDRLREEFARNPRPSNLPVIFDLDAPLAVRKYQEFASSVHPILQRRCAKCHNEANPGDFPLIQTRARRDLTNDLILRANLEATLKLVTQDDLTRSPILMASGLTHGNGGRAVLGSTSTPEYRALAAWVAGLQPIGAKPPSAASPIGRGSPSQPPSEGFATGRRPGVPVDPAMPPLSDGASRVLRSPRTHPGQILTPEELVPPGMREEDRKIIIPPPPRAGTPGDDQFVPGPVPGSPDYAKSAQRAMKASTPKSGGEEPTEPGKIAPGMIALPGGGTAPIMTKEMTLKTKVDPAKKTKFDAKTLDGFMKARPVAK